MSSSPHHDSDPPSVTPLTTLQQDLHPQHGRQDPRRRPGDVAVQAERGQDGGRGGAPARVPPHRHGLRVRQREGGRRRHQGLGRPARRLLPDHQARQPLAQARPRGHRAQPRQPADRLRRPVPHALAQLHRPGRSQEALPGLGLRRHLARAAEARRLREGPRHRREQLWHQEHGEAAGRREHQGEPPHPLSLTSARNRSPPQRERLVHANHPLHPRDSRSSRPSTRSSCIPATPRPSSSPTCSPRASTRPPTRPSAAPTPPSTRTPPCSPSPRPRAGHLSRCC